MQLMSRKGFWVPLLVVALMLSAGFTVKALELYRAEIQVSQWLTEHQSSFSRALSWLVAYGLAPVPAVLLAVAFAFAIWLVWRNLEWLHFVLIALGGWGAAGLIKPLVDRARPAEALLTNPVDPQNNFLSFPSGHTAFAVGLFSAIVLVLVARERWVAGFAIVAVAVVIVGFARVYAGAHYPSDALAGAISGGAGVWFTETVWQYSRERRALAAHEG
ncbi:MAG: phosphatase PAP2 family protein [Actinomycetaceae bacterium]|nr:phosphatase PAP2 family protein [Actinomycetaceae bacterium]